MSLPDLDQIEKDFYEIAKNVYPAEMQDIRFPRVRLRSFEQTWPDSAGGFYKPGQAVCDVMTTEHTTITELSWMICTPTGPKKSSEVIYGVFFGNKCAYIVKNPTEEFIYDLHHDCPRGINEDPASAYNAVVVSK